MFDGESGVIQEFLQELLHRLTADPTRAQPYANLLRREVDGLHSGQGLDVGLRTLVCSGRGAGLVQFDPHVAGQILRRRDEPVGAGLVENQGAQLLTGLVLVY
ncbi:hypothetical protein HCB18_27815, partial [Salinispora arenicola]|uniref:hypothetical protein n=1 Tax=Salinispora arenicola TaxID=168697 RepID=UPI0016B5616B